jgi:hypothetical protein
MGVAMWWKVQEGIDSDQAFAAFRKQVLQSPVHVQEVDGILDLHVMTLAGKLGLKADLSKKQRLAYYSPFPIPNEFLFQVNGKEIDNKYKLKYK